MATRSHNRVLGARTESNLFGKRENVSNVCGQGTWRVIAAVTKTVIYVDLGVITPLYVKLKNRMVAIRNGTPAEEEIKEFIVHSLKVDDLASSRPNGASAYEFYLKLKSRIRHAQMVNQQSGLSIEDTV